MNRVDGPIFEAYPAAALNEWEINSTGYKKEPTARQRVLDDLLASLPSVTITEGDRERCIASDHALDAFGQPGCARRRQPSDPTADGG